MRVPRSSVCRGRGGCVTSIKNEIIGTLRCVVFIGGEYYDQLEGSWICAT